VFNIEEDMAVLRVLSCVASKRKLQAPVQIGDKTTAVEKCRLTRALLGNLLP